MSTTSLIRAEAMKVLTETGVLERKAFAQHLESIGIVFREGHLAGALTSLVTSPGPVSRVGSGSYVIDPAYVTSRQDGENISTVQAQANKFLDRAVRSIRELTKIDLMEVTDEDLQSARKLPQLIEQLEKLKI